MHVPCAYRAKTAESTAFKPPYAVVQPESPSPHRRWAVSGARGRACACRGGDYAAKHGISDETAAVVQGLREKAEEFRKSGGEIYRRA